MTTNQFKIALIPKNDLSSILPLINTLNSEEIPMRVLEKRLGLMMADNFQCLGVYDQGKLIGICGIWILTKFYVGKHVEPDNVFVLPEYRSQGIGKLMLDWVLNYAQEIECDASEVNVYIKNKKGQEFWKEQGYKPIGYHMQQTFNDKK